MTEKMMAAFGQALAFCAGMETVSLESLLSRAAWELANVIIGEFSAIACVVRHSDGSSFVARPPETPTLPVETLLGLLVEQSGLSVACRVRDHALDPVRFIDARFKTSIVVRIEIPEELLPAGDAALWFGLQSVATPRKVECAQKVGQALTRWLLTYSPVVASLIKLRSGQKDLREHIAEMTSVAHDVRAPLGAVRYLISGLGAAYGDMQLDIGHLNAELSYVDTLLAKFAPQESKAVSDAREVADVCGVLQRVCVRLGRQASSSGASLTMSRPSDVCLYAAISELSLERILSNIIGNAVKYAGGGEISVQLDEHFRDELRIVVADHGPGIPEAVMRALHEDESEMRMMAHALGWGTGLRASKKRLGQVGGELLVSSSDSGSTVSVVLRRGLKRKDIAQHRSSTCAALESQQVRDSQRLYGIKEVSAVGSRLIVVDDDNEHSTSLKKVLTRAGLEVETFTSVGEALEYLRGESGSSILCDTRMPDGGVEKLLRILKTEGHLFRCAAMSGESDEGLQYRLAALGAREFFAKPVDIAQLITWVSNRSTREGSISSTA